MNSIIQQYIKIRRIRISGESTSKMISVGEILYAYIINDETCQDDLIEFVDSSILDSIRKICPVAITENDNVYDKQQLSIWKSRVRRKKMALWLIPEFSDEEIVNAPKYKKEMGEMPGVRINLYMEVIGCKDDVFSPFNRIELRYPLKLNDESVKFVERLNAFCKKAVKPVEEL